MSRYLALLIILFAAPSLGVEWEIPIVKPGQNAAEVVMDPSDTADSGYLNAKACGLTNVSFDADVTGDLTAAAATISACSTTSTPEASCQSTVLVDGGSVTIDTSRLPFLQVVTVTAPGAGDTALIRASCQQQFSRTTNGLAPGIQGSVATGETIDWIGTLSTVPFPEAIDQDQWTDYYFSAEAGGAYPLGDDARDGLTPQTAKKTWTEAQTICWGGAYRRCNFDIEDSWTIGNSGYVAGTDKFEDADVVSGACPVWPSQEALEQPCWWLRSSPGSGQAVIDATGTASGVDFFSMSQETERAQTLVENMHFKGDCSGTCGSTPFDSFEGSVLVGVGMTLEVTAATLNSATANISTCHDSSIHHNYGWTPMSYTGAGLVNHGAMIGGQDTCAQVVVSKATIQGGAETGTNTCTIAVAASQPASTIPTDPALAAELLVNPKYDFYAGPTFAGCTGTSTGERLLLDMSTTRGEPENTNDVLSGKIRVGVVESVFSYEDGNAGGTSTSTMVNLRAMGSGTEGDIFLARNLFKQWNWGTAATYGLFGIRCQQCACAAGDPIASAASDCGAEASPNWDFRLAGNIWEDSGESTNFLTFIRLIEDDFVVGGGTLAITDEQYHYDAGSFDVRVHDSSDVLVNGATHAAFLVDWDDTGDGDGDGDASTHFTFTNVGDVAAAFTGTTTASGATSLTDAGSGWTPDEFIGCLVHNESSTAARRATRRITDNTDELLTISHAWTTNPSSDLFEIYCMAEPDSNQCFDNGTNAGPCNGDVTTPSAYTFSFDRRGYIPAYIAGRTLTAYNGAPVPSADTGPSTAH